MSQEPFLFNTSIRENISYGQPDATPAKIEAAARAAGAEEFIERLPAGYETQVGEGGLWLSGGQRQRITIARAILSDPPLLILDEPTSALDSSTESLVQSTIDSLRGEHTIFLIAHRLSTVRNADRIAVLDKGRLSTIGDHDTLMQQSTIYRELVGASMPDEKDADAEVEEVADLK